MAAQRTFDTAELLEVILFELPTRDLLLSQRVCKTWKANIAGSKKLQRALFMLPAKGDALEYKEWDAPFVERSPYGAYPYGGDVIACGWRKRMHCGFVEPGHKTTMTVYENPLLKKLITALMSPTAPDSAIQRLPATWQRENASWKSMHLTQPPLSKLHLQLDWKSGSRRQQRTRVTIDTTLAAGVLEQIQTFIEEKHMGNWCGDLFNGSTVWKTLTNNNQVEELPKADPDVETLWKPRY